jgi:nucleoside-diphosphate-sugar epimerase
MSLVGKKVLCVGGNGYVGNYLAARLIQANASVQILSR